MVAGCGPVTRSPFEYAVLRAVPRVDRGECLNVGVLVYCQAAEFLATRWHVDPDRLRLLDPDVDVAGVEAALGAIAAVCRGGSDAGPAAGQPPGWRFRWLASPRSTVVQVSPIHVGLTDDAADELDRLFDALVART